MISFWQGVFLVIAWILYYLLLKKFIFNKQLDKYIQEAKEKGDYYQSDINDYKRYLKAKGIASTSIVVVVTLGLCVFDYLSINMWLVEIVVILSLAKLTEMIGSKIVKNKYHFKV